MPLMTVAFILFAIVSLISGLFFVRLYRTASPVQRRQMVWGAYGCVVLAVSMYSLFGRR